MVPAKLFLTVDAYAILARYVGSFRGFITSSKSIRAAAGDWLTARFKALSKSEE